MKGVDTLRADRQQCGAAAWGFSFGAVRANEPDLAGEQCGISATPCIPEPRSRRAIGHQCYAVAVAEELVEPWREPVASAEGRVHPDEAEPRLVKAIVEEPFVGGNVQRAALRRGDIQIERLAQCFEDIGGRVPLVGCAGCFPSTHDARTQSAAISTVAQMTAQTASTTTETAMRRAMVTR